MQQLLNVREYLGSVIENSIVAAEVGISVRN